MEFAKEFAIFLFEKKIMQKLTHDFVEEVSLVTRLGCKIRL
tara:strand:- start:19 stop:141 length:123 start_codon:yes stop_codon:yes gene_type:complete